MGADLSALLAVGGAVDGGDILSQKMSIGGPDDRVGLLNGALGSHQVSQAMVSIALPQKCNNY